MKKLLLFFLAAVLSTVSVTSLAADIKDIHPAPAATGTAAATDKPLDAASSPENTKKDEPKPITAELSDGTKIEINSEGEVTAVNEDGSRNPAPDGVLTLKDGVTITIKGGKKISQ